MDRTGQRRDPTDGERPALQPLLPLQGASHPLRACLLSGGASRRMGRDKALLPHPEGGSWLERTLRLLLELEIPVTLFSRHERHLELARALNRQACPPDLPSGNAPDAAICLTQNIHRPGPRIAALAEPPPWEGPLLALQRLMQRYPDERLLLCPVDMPDLSLAALQTLMATAAESPTRLQLAHDGTRLQPLLGVYPSTEAVRADLSAAVQRGERRLQSWLATQPIQAVSLDPRAIRNVNHSPAEQPAGPLPPTPGRQP